MKEKKWVLIALTLVALTVATAYYLFLAEKAHHTALQEASSSPLEVEATLIEEQSSGEASVNLFFYNPGGLPGQSSFLRAEERTLLTVQDPLLMARQIVQEVLKGPKPGEPETPAALTSPLEGRIRQLYFLEDGTVVVDLSSDVIRHLPGGVLSELAFVLSVSRSLTENIEEIERVRFLVEGLQPETLAGHVSLARSFM